MNMMATIEEPCFTETPRGKFIQVIDDSMTPIIQKGDEILVDIQNKQLCDGAVFLFSHSAASAYPWIRRVQQLPDGSVQLKAEDSDWEPDHIRNLEESAFHVVGRVTKVYRDLSPRTA